MDEVSARAELATVESGLTVSVPKSEVLAAVDGDGADLVLDVVRTNGAREERRVTLAWEPAVLKQLADGADGDRVLIAIDPAQLAVAFEDVEAHGLREMGATLAIAVAAVGGGASTAAAEPSESVVSGGPPAIEAIVDTSWQADAAEAGYGVRGGPSDMVSPTSGMAAAVEAGYGQRGGPSDTVSPTSGMAAAVEAGYGQRGGPSDTANESVGLSPDRQDAVDQRAASEASEAVRLSPDRQDAVDQRAASQAVRLSPDRQDAVDAVAAAEVPGPSVAVADDSGSISAPSAGVTAALAGGAALTIAAAAFALRRRREPGTV